MKKHRKTFEEKIEDYAKNASTEIECLSAICKNENRQIQRQISFIDNDIHNILKLIWEKMEKDEK